jgi:LacI family transcriptional regulator
MRARVMAAVEELEYEPDFLAQSLRRGATLSVGYVLSDISNPVLAANASGAESVLRAAGYSMLLMSSENEPTLDAAHVRFLHSRRVDGMILSLSSEREARTIDGLRQLNRPVVLIDRELPVDIGASAVLCDHRAGVTAAVDHLLDLGHRRLAMIAGPMEVRPGHARVAAMREAVGERGDPDQTVYVSGSFSPQFGEHAIYELLDRERPPTAILVGGNQLLEGCLRALTARGVRVGRDVSLVTCDDTPLAAFYSPALSVIDRDGVRLGEMAADLLLRRLGDDQGPETAYLPTTFIPRGSTTPPAS